MNYLNVAKKQLEVFAGINPASPRIASIAAAIAQAEAAERQATAMEKIASLFASVVEQTGGSLAINTCDVYAIWKDNR